MANRRMVSVSSPETEPPFAPPTREEIAARAYELFLERGAGEGRDVEDWVRAEEELQRSRTYETV